MLLVVAFVLGLLLAEGSGTKTNDVIREKEIVRTRPDTVLSIVEVPLRSIAINAKRNHTTTVIEHDTVFAEDCLDTLLTTDTAAIAPDTLSVCYARNAFALSLELAARRKPVEVPYLARDTFYWRADSIRIESGNGHAWYDNALMVILAIAAGIIVGKL